MRYPPPNNGMHPTRKSAALIVNGSSGRVMPGVRRLTLLKIIEAMNRRSSGAGIILFVIVGLYCFMGLIQAVWLSATPNFPQDRTNRNLFIWGTGTIISLAGFVVCSFKYFRNRDD